MVKRKEEEGNFVHEKINPKMFSNIPGAVSAAKLDVAALAASPSGP
jgi:hypothetical protein